MTPNTKRVPLLIVLSAILSLLSESSIAGTTVSNCVNGPLDPNQGEYYANVWWAYGVGDGAHYYCYGAYRSTALEACTAAYTGARSYGIELWGDIPVTVSSPPAQIGQWGSCSPMGNVAWLGNAPPCPVQPLTPLTGADAIRFENGDRWRPDRLTPDFQAKLQCFTTGIQQAGGSYTPESAWRPTEYQSHLREIVSKDRQLNASFMRAYPQCAPIRQTVTAEMSFHHLRTGQLVAQPGRSRHESGQAFDVTPSGLSTAQLDAIAAQCNVQRNALPSEPWHYQ